MKNRFTSNRFIDWFWSAVNKDGRSNPVIGRCWEWTKSKTKAGYGQLTRRKISKMPMLAHRVSWEMEKGNPNDLHVLHQCDNPCCVRPSHLFLGTQKDNNKDRTRKGRTASGNRNGARTKPERNPFIVNRGSGLRGEDHPMAKLSNQERNSIRKEFTEADGKRGTMTNLAIKYGVTITQISRIVRGVR